MRAVQIRGQVLKTATDKPPEVPSSCPGLWGQDPVVWATLAAYPAAMTWEPLWGGRGANTDAGKEKSRQRRLLGGYDVGDYCGPFWMVSAMMLDMSKLVPPCTGG